MEITLKRFYTNKSDTFTGLPDGVEDHTYRNDSCPSIGWPIGKDDDGHIIQIYIENPDRADREMPDCDRFVVCDTSTARTLYNGESWFRAISTVRQALLIDKYEKWCDERGLPKMSADELIYEVEGVGEKKWLTDFIDEWVTWQRADANSHLDHESAVKKLANIFSWEMWLALTDSEMAEVIEANREPKNAGTCASHDVCDANMVMMEAWTKFFGVDDINGDDEDQCRLWNEAWAKAKANEFKYNWMELDR